VVNALYRHPPFWRDWLALAVAAVILGLLLAVAWALGIEWTAGLPLSGIDWPAIAAWITAAVSIEVAGWILIAISWES
jgi:hypothetical protein